MTQKMTQEGSADVILFAHL